MDCDDARACVTTDCTKVDWYLDKDADGSYAKKLNDYKSCKPVGSWNSTSNNGIDCDDRRKCVTTSCTKVNWYLDKDADGYYVEKKNDYKSCNPDSGFKWNTTSNSGLDCNDDIYDLLNLDISCYGNNNNPCDKKISKKHLIEKANEYGIAKEAVMAIYNVETRGSAFRTNGDPKVLFERHRFSILTNGKYDSSHPGISNPIKGGYGTENSQLSRLKEAYDLDPVAATKSASFGAFQIMGFNYKLVGYNDLTKFYNDMTSTNVDLHLNAFFEYAKNKELITAINNKNWDAVAKGYNGKAYNAKDSYSKGYDKKIEKEYNKYINNPNLINDNDCL